MEVDPPAVPNGTPVANGAGGGGQNGVIANGSSVESYVVDKPVETSSRKSSPEKASDDSMDGSEYSKIDAEDAIVECTLPELMEKMRSVHYNYKNDVAFGHVILAKCKWLFEKDYEIRTVRNKVTDNYPLEIIIPVARKGELNEKNIGLDTELYDTLTKEAHVARLRSRVVAPVILFDDKFICRSGTLTVWLSAMYEAVTQKTRTYESLCGPVSSGVLSDLWNAMLDLTDITINTTNLLLWDKIVMENKFKLDSKILELLNVGNICDLMVEYNKHFKEQVNVSASERVHEQFYEDIKILDMPYPGCEFFKEYNEAKRNPEGLMFDWSQNDVKRELDLKGDVVFSPPINTLEFKAWDLVELTRKYLTIMLWYLVTSEDKGMVVHCVSGWDRTPLFISLLRLSLWADGVVHKKLDFKDMAYLTLAYDWFLFGHDLPNRLYKKEEIMHFCFNFLQYITSDEFSVTRIFSELPKEQRRDRQFPNFTPGERLKLNDVRTLVLDTYESVAIRPKTD